MTARGPKRPRIGEGPVAARSTPFDEHPLATLHDLVDGLAAFGERPALIAFTPQGRQEWSYGQLARTVEQLGRGLVRAGLRPGDAVALFAPDGPEWIAAALAALQAGAMIAPLDAQFSDESLAHTMADSRARLVFTTGDRVDRLRRARPEARVIRLDAAEDDPTSWRHCLRAERAALPVGQPGDTAALFYTSGTTGPPKGVPLTHCHLAFQIDALVAVGLVGPSDRVCLPLPLHHVYPFVVGVLTPLRLGLALLLPEALTGPQVLRAIREGDATVLMGVPRLYAALLAAIEARIASQDRVTRAFVRLALALSMWARRRLDQYWGKRLLGVLHAHLAPSLRLLACGGAALDPGIARKLEGLGWQLATGYGLTETSPLLTLNLPPSPRPDSAGRPLPGVQLRIDPRRGGAAGEGEIQARGPGVFAGYLNLPERTREAFTPDGWFRTGDVGYLSAEGHLHITGRVDEMLVTPGGENVHPENVEAIFLGHPFIREFALLQREGRLVGLVLPAPEAIERAGRTDIPQAVRDAITDVNAQLPSYQRVSDVAITRDPLPRTRLGKLRRPWLPDAYERARALGKGAPEILRPMALSEMPDADRLLLEHTGARAVWEWLAERYQGRRLTLDLSPTLDLAVDSLEWLSLTLEIERRARVELEEAAIARVGTLRDLLREVTAAAALGEHRPGVPWDEPEKVLSAAQTRWLEPPGRGLKLLARAMFALNGALMRLLFRVRPVGLEHLPEAPWVLVPNHVSFLDPPVLCAALGWRRLRHTYWGGWTGVAFANAPMRAMSRLAKVLPIEPERRAASSLALAAAVLRRGDCLVWFPEGERSPSGRLLPFRPGIGLLLARFPRPAVPVYIRGTFEALPRGRRWPGLHRVTVAFGPAVDPMQLAAPEASLDEAAQRITRALQERVAALQRAGTPDGRSRAD